MPRNQGTSRKGKPKKGERAAGMGRALQKSQRQGGASSRIKNKHGGMGVVGSGVATPDNATSAVMAAAAAEKNMSLLELDHLDDFLVQAEMAGREFESEKARFVVLDSHGTAHQPGQRHVQWQDQAPATMSKHQFSFEELSVPRRPPWNEDTTPEELDRLENEAFLEWRRAIAAKEEELFASSQQHQHAYFSKTVTPYEKNLHVWRQLWRVLERSTCVVGVLDARNPIFYLSYDLKKYAQSLEKPMMLIVNKGDFLSMEQRRQWSKYLQDNGWAHVFFSAHLEQAKLDKAAAAAAAQAHNIRRSEDVVDPPETSGGADSARLLTRQELTDFLMDFAKRNDCKPNPRYNDRYQFGTVGFPNVGKSSVINVLMGSSKHTHGLARVGVAAQPGKTKHFQTLLLPERDDMMLCDCPGLVFPSFVSNTADLIAAGVYPIAQMRDPWPVVELICNRIPRTLINAVYGIQLPELSQQQLKEKGLEKVPPPTAEEFLSTYCVARSMLAASSGVPDYTRASRTVIKDYVSGKLLYCHPPPDVDDREAFRVETTKTAILNSEKLEQKLSLVANPSGNQEQQEELEEAFQANEKEEAFDEDFSLEISGGQKTGNTDSRGKQARGKVARGKKKGSKKNRDPDPYGCHKSPDEIMLQEVPTAGIVVNAGKYGRSGYTRPTSYGGARAAS